MRLQSLIIISVIFLCSSCSDNQPTKKEQVQDKAQSLTELQWRDSVLDLGTIKAAKSYPIVFYVKNIGNTPLIFEKIESTCGCTVVDQKINKPILPSMSDSILGHFKLSEAIGYAERKIYILANTPQQFYVLRIKAHVVE